MTIKIIDGKDMNLAIDTAILLQKLFPGATHRHHIDLFSRRLNFITILEVPDDSRIGDLRFRTEAGANE